MRPRGHRSTRSAGHALRAAAADAAAGADAMWFVIPQKHRARPGRTIERARTEWRSGPGRPDNPHADGDEKRLVATLAPFSLARPRDTRAALILQENRQNALWVSRETSRHAEHRQIRTRHEIVARLAAPAGERRHLTAPSIRRGSLRSLPL